MAIDTEHEWSAEGLMALGAVFLASALLFIYCWSP
jgi:hypothetical protein